MFSKRHEQELAEIKAVSHELSRRLQEVLEGLHKIQQGQELLLAAERPAAGPGGDDDANGDGSAEHPVGTKRARRERSAAVAEATKAAKGRGRSGSEGGAGRKRAGKKRRSAESSDPSADHD